MRALLEVRNLETRFFTPEGMIKAVNGVSFQISARETLGIVGESGSGKSITMLSLTRLLPASGKVTHGEVLFNRRDLLQLTAREMRKLRGDQISLIFQDPMTSLNPVLPISKQISESLMLHRGMSRNQAQTRAVELLELVGIPGAKERVKNYPHQFSGGMRQRVMIAMGLACNPQLLIADEPTTALDVTIQAQIVDLVKRLQTQLGMAVIWITHDLALLARLATRIMVMYAGQVVETAPVSALYKNPHHPYTVGLLQSIPRLVGKRAQRLQAIQGLPPDLINYPQGCPFAPRCPHVIAKCRTQDPPLETVGEQHQVACWVKL